MLQFATSKYVRLPALLYIFCERKSSQQSHQRPSIALSDVPSNTPLQHCLH